MTNQNDLQLQDNLKNYFEYEEIKENKEYVLRLSQDPNRKDELTRIIGQRLLFGTAGIRGRMGPGFGQMNDLVIIQTSQGLASYLLEHFGQEQCMSRGVIIGHDARHNSSRFARLAARAFQHHMKVRFCQRIIPTPLVAFGVKHFNCLAGVVVTASHNPKWDNGYKVYWSNGAQILSPHDKNIQQHIERASNLKPWPNAWKIDEKDYDKTSLHECQDELVENYYKYVRDNIIINSQRPQSDLRITYTTMHGVGHQFLTYALTELANFKQSFPVEQQLKPDPNFTTVEFPNPEEHGALDLAFETAAKTNSMLVIANDPDADRCAAALYDGQTNMRRTLTGNELGSLLGWWLWHTRRDAATKTADKFYMLSTAVSSRFLNSMASAEGFNFVETLTGFKYMGNEAERILQASRENVVLFAYEEAIGYMVCSDILDKDGITAAVQIAQCTDYLLRVERRTLVEQLDWLYMQYGYHFSLNSYYICHERYKIKEIFEKLQDYPKKFSSTHPEDDFIVYRVRDLNKGYDSAQPDYKPELPTSSSSYMVSFFVKGDITLTIRTSGTEPKIKYYSEIVAQLPTSVSDEEFQQAKGCAQQKLRRLVDSAIERCLAPQDYNLRHAAVD